MKTCELVKSRHKIRLQRICISFRIMIFVSIISVIGSSILYPFFVDGYIATSLGHFSSEVTLHLKLIYIGLDLFSDISPIMFMLCLSKLFLDYQKSVFFTEHQVKLLSYMAFWLLMDCVVSFLVDGAKSGVLMTHNGQLSFEIVFSSYQIVILGASLVCYAISIVMQTALAYKHEYDLTV